jgi:hypothetical protein
MAYGSAREAALAIRRRMKLFREVVFFLLLYFSRNYFLIEGFHLQALGRKMI